MHVMAALMASPAGQPLPGFLNTVGRYLSEFGYWAIFLVVMLEDFGVPLPGETILIAGAVYAGTGRLNVVEVGVVGFAAAVIGDNIGYGIGRFGGRALVARWGRYILLTPPRLTSAERFFDSHGGKVITIARFLEGLRQANGLIAGIIRMHWLRFVAFNALGAALWVGAWVSAGYFGGQHISTIYGYVTRYSLYALAVVVVLALAWLAHHLRKRRRARAAPAQAAAAEAAEAPAGPAAEAAAGATSDEATSDEAAADVAVSRAGPPPPDEAPAPGDVAAPGDAQAPGDVAAPGEAQAPGDAAAPGDAQAPGDAAAPGEAQAPGEAEAPGEAQARGEAEAPGEPSEASAGRGTDRKQG